MPMPAVNTRNSGSVTTAYSTIQFPLSMAAWVFASKYDAPRTVLGCTHNGINYGCTLWFNYGAPQVYMGLLWSPTISELPVQTWTHLAVTIDGDGVGRFYTNGVLAATSTDVGITGTADPGSYWIVAQQVGFTTNTGTLEGLEVGLWTNLLSADAVARLATTNRYISGDLTNDAVLVFHFDEGSGSIASNAVAPYDGTINGPVAWSNGYVLSGATLADAPDLYVTATNTTLDYTASNALVTVLASSTNTLTTNDAYAYVVNLANNTTNQATGWTLAATTDLSNSLYTANISATTLGTNVAAGVWVSSNVSATIKGLGAIYAP